MATPVAAAAPVSPPRRILPARPHVPDYLSLLTNDAHDAHDAKTDPPVPLFAGLHAIAAASPPDQRLPPLPASWSPTDKSGLVDLSHANMRAIYQGSGKSDSDAVAVRANAPIPPKIGIFYYEITIVSKGRDGYIGIGFCDQRVLLGRLPGWEDHSWGYHGDDGNIFSGSGSGRPYGPTFTTKDVIGCCINFLSMSAFYTKNGVMLGVAFRNIATHRRGTPISLYPSVGLRTPGEVVEANFGQRPFVFDIAQYCKDERARFFAALTTSPLVITPPIDANVANASASAQTPYSTSLLKRNNPATNKHEPSYSSATAAAAAAASSTPASALSIVSPAWSPVVAQPARSAMGESAILNSIVLQHLIQGGYNESAATFYRSAFGETPAPSGDKRDVDRNGKKAVASADLTASVRLFDDIPGARGIRDRQHIQRLIIEGNIDTAITEMTRIYPGLLETNKALQMQLDCLKFIRLVEMVTDEDGEHGGQAWSEKQDASHQHNRNHIHNNSHQHRHNPRAVDDGDVVIEEMGDMDESSIDGMLDHNVDDEQEDIDNDVDEILEDGSIDDDDDDDDTNDVMDVEKPYPTLRDGLVDNRGNDHAVSVTGGLAGAVGPLSHTVDILDAIQYGRYLQRTYGNGFETKTNDTSTIDSVLHQPSVNTNTNSGSVTAEDAHRILQEVFALICYPSPRHSPVSHLLNPDIRRIVAVHVNEAILEYEAYAHRPVLDRLYRQAVVTHQSLIECDVGAASFVNPERILQSS